MKQSELKALQGKVIALMLDDGQLSAGIRWRVYGFGAQQLWLRSIDGKVESRLSLADFEELVSTHRIAVRAEDPAPLIIAESLREQHQKIARAIEQRRLNRG